MPEILMTGIAFGESPRWHEGRLWFSDWMAQEVLAVDTDGKSEVVVGVDFPSMPMCIDPLPDGRMLVVSSSEGLIMRLEPDGSLVRHAELGDASVGYNEIVVDGRGNIYVNAIGFDMMAGEEFKPGVIVLVTPDGAVRRVADGVAFPNGMAVTSDGSTLVVAESYGQRLTAFDIEADGGLSDRRVWAGTGDDHPDGICFDAENAVWYADVGNKRCVRVREGGEVLQTVTLDRGCFSCALGGADGRTLFIVATEWGGPENVSDERTGRIVTERVSVPAASRPWTRWA
jgi:sugar lactone lactonase YvrE